MCTIIAKDRYFRYNRHFRSHSQHSLADEEPATPSLSPSISWSPVEDEHSFTRLNDALETYAAAVKHCWSTCSKVQLHCTIPTCPSRNADLNDLKTLQSRLLGFLHTLVKLLRTNGLYASYHLNFSETSLVVVRALAPSMDPATQAKEDVALERAKAYDPNTTHVLVLDDTPVLVVS